MVRKHIIIFYVISFLVFSACAQAPVEQIITLVPEETLPDFLASLSQLNDYPFFAAEYSGDYEFDAYIESGRYPERTIAYSSKPAYACSCFFAGGGSPVYGRNFDWYENPALALVTRPENGYASISMVDISYLGYDREITPLDFPDDLFYAPYYPFDGMNEKGLAVGMMAVGHAEGGADTNKITIGSLEAIRLMLDYAADVSQALALLADYNVEFGSVPVHYLIADTQGNSAVIEFLGGEIVVIENENPWQVSTNFIISEVQPQGAESPSGRHNRLEAALMEVQGDVSVPESLDLLADVAQAGETGTRWSAVYDLEALTVTIAIDRDFENTYQFSLEQGLLTAEEKE